VKRRGYLADVLFLSLTLPSAVCTTVIEVPVSPGHLQIQVQFASAPTNYNIIELTWLGDWQSGSGGTLGATITGQTLDLTAAALAQTSGVASFPVSIPLRAGSWKIALVVTGDATQIIAATCLTGVFDGKSNKVVFTQGTPSTSAACTCSQGCAPPP
jgi:hypothetical protein